jgi:GDPmannose 4,6-dehydratase
VRVDSSLLRPAEVVNLVGDASKAERELAWRPRVSFEELVAMMVEADLARLSDAHGTSNRPESQKIPAED